MSSGERAGPQSAKAQATYEERNPFDISRRSEKEVAAEIAQRMAAWKQARGRSYPTPTAPADERKAPSISAPVQPARLPKFAERGAQPHHAAQQPQAGAQPSRRIQSATGAGGAETRAPFLASLSIRRAMPSAPSLKQAPVAQPKPQVQHEAAPEREASSVDMPAAEAEAGALHPPAMEGLGSGSHHEDARETHGSRLAVIEGVGSAATAPVLLDADVHRSEPPGFETARVTVPDEPAAVESDDIEIRRAKARDIRTRWIAARDLDGPQVEEAPAIQSNEGESGSPSTLQIEAQGGANLEMPAPTITTPQIAAPEEARGRKEPTFDALTGDARQPEAEVSIAAVMETHEIVAPSPDRPLLETPELAPATPKIDVLDDSWGRREPTFDTPFGKPDLTEATLSAPSENGAPEIKRRPRLPAIETRIEARRIETLRADPQLAVRWPIFPHTEPEEWDIPPAIATRARSTRGGTGWAIGLGGVLLIIGITAPAAIWQQGRQGSPSDQNRVAMVNPVPQPPEQPASRPSSPSAAPATLPSAPQPQISPPTPPAIQASDPPAANLPAPQVKPDAGEAGQQTALGAVGDGGELKDAPVNAPPPRAEAAQEPAVNLASKAGTQPSAAGDRARLSPMVARPFVPEQVPTPFMRAPTMGSASVGINGAPPAGTSTAAIELKPNLMGTLKPAITAVPAAKAVNASPQKVVRKPKPFQPQALEQMFHALVDTLSEGQQPNPAGKPVPRSLR